MRGMLQAARSYRVATLVPIAGLFLAGLMALSACSSAVLSFFFDGVPSPGDGAEKPSPETAQQVEPIGPKPAPPPDEMTVHRPYAEGKCDKCHSSRFGKPEGISAIFQGVPMLLEPIEKLCFKCHQIEKKQFLHAPAVAGQCIFCHDPHRMPNRRMLLTRSTRDLCARCHSGSTFLTAEEHREYGDRECTDCHDPHAADFEYSLLPGVKGGEPEPRKPTVSLPDDW